MKSGRCSFHPGPESSGRCLKKTRRLFHLLLAEIRLTLKLTYGNFVVVSSKFSEFSIKCVKVRAISLFALMFFIEIAKKKNRIYLALAKLISKNDLPIFAG